MPEFPTWPDHYVEVCGISVRYWKAGDGPRTVVLLHGFSGSVFEWALNIAALEAHYTVIVLDLPGHGKTGKPELDYDYDFFTSFLHAFFAAIGIDTALLVGHSMGGMIALHFCTAYPQMVRKLVLIAPAYATRFPLLFHLMTIPMIGELMLRPPVSPKAVARAFRIITFSAIDYDQECINQYFHFQHSSGYIHAQLSYVRGVINLFGLTQKGRRYQKHFEQKLPQMQQPILLVWGKQDKIVPFKNAARLRTLLPGSEFWELDQCGHCPHFEYVDEFNEQMTAFLNG